MEQVSQGWLLQTREYQPDLRVLSHSSRSDMTLERDLIIITRVAAERTGMNATPLYDAAVLSLLNSSVMLYDTMPLN